MDNATARPSVREFDAMFSDVHNAWYNGKITTTQRDMAWDAIDAWFDEVWGEQPDS